MHKKQAPSHILILCQYSEVLIVFSFFAELMPKMIFMLSYVTNVSSFAKPLTPDEEKMYLERYKNGDKEAKNILIERNLRLVAHVVKKYPAAGDNDDLISIGTIGLIKAITSYNVDKGTRLATYAARCIENEILMSMRSNKKRQAEVLLQDPVGTDAEGKEISLMDKIGSDGEDVFEEVETKLQIKELYEKLATALGKREKKIIELRYGLCGGNSFTQKEIAKLLGISRSYVSRIEKKALKKLSDKLRID
ncbi:MAG: RNA polymerase sporulation sigma factor SigK [Clostridia bacterium]|nr:RNA polymerase sporulation sigma factor SigK [Clostridia bacterium]